MSTLESTHLSVRIERSSRVVYDYVFQPENLANWADGLGRGLTREGDSWVGDGPAGRIHIRFTPRNDLGVVDHHVTTADGTVVDVPLRVIPNGDGSEVIFTLFRLPSMSDEEYRRDAATVRRDLEKLKRVVEAIDQRRRS